MRRTGCSDHPIRVGVSACLLGHEVRYDGSHRRDAFVTETLERFVEFVPVCPEVELGLGVPRETLRLERRGDEIRMIGEASGYDHTLAMREYAEVRLGMLAGLELSGYILKRNSPSCGLQDVAIFGGGYPRRGRGLFAAALTRRWPLLPVEEEAHLNDIPGRENFLERIFAYHRVRCFFKECWTRASLASFHLMHELQLQTHAPGSHRELSRLIHDARSTSDLQLHYEMGFMRAMAKPATPARHAHVLRQIAGLVCPHLEAPGRGELDEAIRNYHAGRAPLSALIGLMRHYAGQFEIGYLKCQSYFEPYPLELMVQANR